MHSSLVGKVEKAKRYAQEPDRVTFQSSPLIFAVSMIIML